MTEFVAANSERLGIIGCKTKSEADRIPRSVSLVELFGKGLLSRRLVHARGQARFVARGCVFVQDTFLHGFVND